MTCFAVSRLSTGACVRESGMLVHPAVWKPLEGDHE